jgi:hypothetical protein
MKAGNVAAPHHKPLICWDQVREQRVTSGELAESLPGKSTGLGKFADRFLAWVDSGRQEEVPPENDNHGKSLTTMANSVENKSLAA